MLFSVTKNRTPFGNANPIPECRPKSDRGLLLRIEPKPECKESIPNHSVFSSEQATHSGMQKPIRNPRVEGVWRASTSRHGPLPSPAISNLSPTSLAVASPLRGLRGLHSLPSGDFSTPWRGQKGGGGENPGGEGGEQGGDFRERLRRARPDPGIASEGDNLLGRPSQTVLRARGIFGPKAGVELGGAGRPRQEGSLPLTSHITDRCRNRGEAISVSRNREGGWSWSHRSWRKWRRTRL
jgi:hypothetical protein